MLTHLHIKNFAIAPELELDFGAGFTAITGETGAGKSILVDALGLLLGDRSDTAWVRDGSERAELSAEFDVSANAAARTWLEAAELAADGTCLLRRTIGANGRSRGWINGTPVTVQQLAELGDRLVEIHGQNEHLRLVQPASRLRLLDSGGGYGADREAVKKTHGAWHEIDQRYAELSAASALSPDELDLLRYQCRELEEEALSAELLEQLEAEHRMLSHGDEIIATVGSALERLDGDDGALSDELNRLSDTLGRFEGFDPEIANALRLLEEAAINAREAGASLGAALRHVSVDPGRLQEVRGQLDRLSDLARKHRVPMEELPARRDALAGRLERADAFGSKRGELERELEAALNAYRTASAALSKRRADWGRKLAGHVRDLMAELGMEGGVFEIRIQHDAEARPSAAGNDKVELLVSANPGIAPGPLSKIASGGELSRISLAIKVASAGDEARTQVFDEVDAGIGGATANAVGRLLHRLADAGQALCVTHLAQVAACAQHQVRVDKSVSRQAVSVETIQLEGDQRVREIARMLSGKTSEQSLEHARELLSAAPA